MKELIHILLIILISQLSIGQDIDFERNLNLRGKDALIHDGRLWITDSTGNNAKTNFMFLENDTFKLFSNQLNQFHFLKEGNLRLLNLPTNSTINLKSDGIYNTESSILSFHDPGPLSVPGDFILGTNEFAVESSGISGNGATVTIWSPGDEIRSGTGISANLVILDEDAFLDSDANPYNNGAIVAYLNTSGIWTVSDKKRKENIRELNQSLEIVKKLQSYKYSYAISDK